MAKSATLTPWLLILVAGIVLGCQALQPRLPDAVPATPSPTSEAHPTLLFTLIPTATPRPSPTPTPAATPVLTATAVFTHQLWLPLVMKGAAASEAPIVPAALHSTPPITSSAPASLNVPILMYHYISPLPADADKIRQDLTVTPETFAAQLAYLREAGYTSISLFDLFAALQGEIPLPEKPVVLTFDDGYADAYEYAFPLLRDYGFTGTFFVIANVIEGGVEGFLTWEQAREMAAAGMSMQSHSLDHVDLRERSAEFLRHQLEGSRALIEARVGQPVRFFCYPAGRYDEATVQAVEQAGYWGAVTTAWGNTHTLRGRYTWSRLRVRGEWTLEAFKAALP